MANYYHDPHPMPLVIPPPPPLPESVQFRPTPRECIMFLLRKFIDKPLPCSHIFDDLDPYDPNHLPSLFLSAEHQEHLYLFTKLSKKGKSSTKSGYRNANRTVGEGSWHCDQTDYVTHSNGTKLGHVRTLSYRQQGSAYDRRFQIHEYSLLENTTPLRYNPLKDYVLCHLSRNDRWCNGKKVASKKKDYCSSSVDVSTVSNQEVVLPPLPAPEDRDLLAAAALFVRSLAMEAPPAELPHNRAPEVAHEVEEIITTQDHPAASVPDIDLEDFLMNDVDYEFDAEIQLIQDENLKKTRMHLESLLDNQEY